MPLVNKFHKSRDGLIFSAEIMDSLEIHCPRYNDTLTQHKAEYSIIYMASHCLAYSSVSEYGYKNCILDKELLVGQCLSPHARTSIRLTVREVSPRDDGPEFHPGHSYYFITTSDGTKAGVNLQSQGLCKTKNLKMIMRVKSMREDVKRQRTHKKTNSYDNWPRKWLGQSVQETIPSRTTSRRLSEWNVDPDLRSNGIRGFVIEPSIRAQPQENNVFEVTRLYEEPVILYEVHEFANIGLDTFQSSTVPVNVAPGLTNFVSAAFVQLDVLSDSAYFAIFSHVVNTLFSLVSVMATEVGQTVAISFGSE
ncbi:ephrin b2 [Trichuris trichiura]|uniref:Ephrin b2 n=1 Tax=Trichuris trichiura TaxID=36087 RepID=A0A077YWK7_TRITR|nr:ephrin b2 [Trichuris trichiura]